MRTSPCLLAIVLLLGCGADTPRTSAAAPNEPPPPRPADRIEPGPEEQEPARWDLAVAIGDLDAPTGDARDRIVAAPTITLQGAVHPLEFRPLLHDGDRVGDGVFGQLVDHTGAPLTHEDGSPRLCNGDDFNSLIAVDDGLFLVSHIECQPGALYVSGLSRDGDGLLAPRWTRPIDMAPHGGGAHHCAGDVTPWNTHLASEEYEVDARSIGADGRSPDNWEKYNQQALYWGDLSRANPYSLGWIPEITLDAEGAATVAKRYSLGRFSHELALVMPDRRTLYLSDDGTNGGFFLFVADRAEDLSDGTLYAARWDQLESGEAYLGWIDLGRADEALVQQALAAGTKFDQLFEAGPRGTPTEPCPGGLRSVHTMFGRECLAPRPGQELLASRLETRRYAAWRGATTEFRKAEGLALDPIRTRLYLAISAIGRGMTKASAQDTGGPDHIRQPPNPCGGILDLRLADKVPDSQGAPIDSAYVATEASWLLRGEPLPGKPELCSPDSIANPDNVTMLPGSPVLFIAEDSSRHANNVLWAMHTDTGELRRMATAPTGGEWSGIHWFPNLGGHSYMLATVQHPFRELFDRPEPPGADKRTVNGYFGPFPAMAAPPH